MRLAGRVAESEHDIGHLGPLTLVHGDASVRNMRTGPGGEVVLLDWEDVSAAPGVLDPAWLLLSSVEPARWDAVIAAYGAADPPFRCAAGRRCSRPAEPGRQHCRFSGCSGMDRTP